MTSQETGWVAGAGADVGAAVGANAGADAGRLPRARASQALPAVLSNVLALMAGALLACAFAPLDLWPLAVICPAIQMWLWEGASARSAAWSGFWFGAGTFALGTWWLYISIRGVGGAPIWLALFLVIALVGIMALYQALLGYLSVRLLPASGALRWLVGLPALWLLVEWWRGWFLSGFPWLSLGYSQTETPLGGFAPVLGVYGVSLVLLLGSGALLALLRGGTRARVWAVLLLVLPWPAGALLQQVSWTHPVGAPLSVAVLQGAIPEDLKWQADNIGPTRDLYARLQQQALGARLIVWPEAAIPQLANEIPNYLGDIYSRASARGSDVIMGILRVDEAGRYYNSIMTLAARVSFYDKHHLVPFAEYFPVPSFIRSWLRLMDLPYSDFTPGPAVQPPIRAAGTLLAPSVCYEDAYGSADLPALRRGATLLVNVTNDAWFGHSWARYQHFQIARMRALEAARPLIRAANDGISALVGPHGRVLVEAPDFQRLVMRGSVQPRGGLTPFAWMGSRELSFSIGSWRTTFWLGNAPVVVLGLLAACCCIGRRLSPSNRNRSGTG
jgi:apolipoprotein N-acyltransferase